MMKGCRGQSPAFNPMKDLLATLVEKKSFLHGACAGGGTELAQLLTNRPGASAWMSGIEYPYEQEETRSLIGFTPVKGYVNMSTAIHLAMWSYMKAYRFGVDKVPVGFGLEAALASETLHKGDHRIHACVITPTLVLTSTLILEKRVGIDQRIKDNQQCSSVVWNLLAIAHGLDPFFTFDVEKLENQTLLDMLLERPYTDVTGSHWERAPEHIVLMPGAYNPPHDGHFGVATSAAKTSGRPVVHHLTIDSPHKPTLSAQEVLQRMKLLKGHDMLVTMGDPMYIQKAERFPKTPIVVGTDALVRLFDPKWGLPVAETLDRFRQLGTTFYVSERPTQTLDKMSRGLLTLDRVLSDAGIINDGMFKRIEGSWNISSTELRNAALSRG